MDFISQIVGTVNSFLWDYALLFLLCGTGIYFTIRLKAVQIRKFKEGFRKTFGGLSLRGQKADGSGMSSFQSLATAVAAQVGTGNLAGAATALLAGGPGAIFWMWVSAFFGMATIFGEATLAQKYRTEKNGEILGGPAYYIRRAFKGKAGKVLAALFSVFTIVALGFTGNMVQSNSIGDAFHNAFGVESWVVGIVVAVAAGFVFVGGVKRIASVTEKIVPIMALVYILGALVIVAVNFKNIPEAFRQIFVGAFAPQALVGGVAGATVQRAMRFGVARGLFSNEAGMGSTPHAHALAKVKDPCEQGVVAMMGVFIDTFVILTLTALVVLTTGVMTSGKEGVQLPQAGFESVFGSFGVAFIAICMLFFAFSTIVGWYFFGETNIKYLFGKKAVKIYAVLVVGFIILGSALKVDLVWSLADLFNGMMVLPNLLALLVLSRVIARALKTYEVGQKSTQTLSELAQHACEKQVVCAQEVPADE